MHDPLQFNCWPTLIWKKKPSKLISTWWLCKCEWMCTCTRTRVCVCVCVCVHACTFTLLHLNFCTSLQTLIKFGILCYMKPTPSYKLILILPLTPCSISFLRISLSSSHKTSHISWNVKFYYCVNNSPTPVPTLPQTNTVHTLTSYSYKIHYKINLLYRYFVWSHSIRFANKTLLPFSSFACVPHALLIPSSFI